MLRRVELRAQPRPIQRCPGGHVAVLRDHLGAEHLGKAAAALNLMVERAALIVLSDGGDGGDAGIDHRADGLDSVHSSLLNRPSVPTRCSENGTGSTTGPKAGKGWA